MEPLEFILVGIVHLFKLVMADGGFGVYRKLYRDGSDRVTYLIALVPSLKTPNKPPSSVLTEFTSEAEAIGALARWRQDPSLTQPARHKKKKQASDPAQTEFPLGPYKTREQLEFEACRQGGRPQ